VDTRLNVRHATLDDVAALRLLIADSARGLGAGDYTASQIESALRGVFGVDTQLILDRTYFVVESAGRIVGCGGWSRRSTMFGSDALPGRNETMLRPGTEPARIRAFFVHPDFARTGIGRRLLETCESEAARSGFDTLELMATLPGLPFYERLGYSPEEPIDYPLAAGDSLRLVPMRKALGQGSREHSG
jgi:GNAT superfamily N-acetyltransferase